MFPILLVNGLGDKNFSFMRGFVSVKRELTKKGYKVYLSKQDGLGTIEDNGEALKEEILEIVKNENVAKIHIIAHSKGGLDARYAISKCGMDKFVLSLTTLSTPHHGSELSRRLLKMPKLFAKIIDGYWNLFYLVLGDAKPNLLKTAKELTPEYVEKFNEEVVDKKGVYYQSYSAYPLKKEKSLLLLIPHFLNCKFGKEKNDGIVDVESAKWGIYRGEIPAWHHNLIRMRLSKKKNKMIMDVYYKIIDDIKKLEE